MSTLLLLVSSCVLLLLVEAVPMEINSHSKEPHFTPGNEHNEKFDHDAFLGKEAEEFRQLSQEESKRRLRIICLKIDKDNDGYIDHDELKDWVKHVTNRYITENVDRQFPHYDLDKDEQISLVEYIKATYGTVEDPDAEYDPHRKLSYKQMMERDERKFKVSDVDGNGYLDRNEFTAFMHPEEHEHMKDVIIDEAFEDMDKDRDGLITVDEYLADIWPAWDRKEDEGEPEWIANEKEHFTKHRDKDGDQRINRRELVDWIAPAGFDHAEAEARHLIHNADSDKDKKLTIDEVIDNSDLFVGSQATDFGNYLYRHDEF